MAAEGRFGPGWEKLRKIAEEFDKRIRTNARQALLKAGEELASDIRKRILDGKGMKSLHGFTIQQKGSSKPLIDDGDLLGSVGVRVLEELAVFVGVHRRSESGVDLASLHEREEGTRVPVTPAMRAFLHMRGFHLRAETKELFIPGRPFVKPAYQDFRDRKAPEKIVAEFVEKTLSGE